MQQFFLLVFFLLLFSEPPISAQTISYSEEVGALEKQQLVDAKNCFFKNQASVSHIWKLNLIDFLNTEVNFLNQVIGFEMGMGIGYEQRLKTGWSLNFSLDGNLVRGRLNKYQDDFFATRYSNFNSAASGIAFSVEPRWYFKKKKQVELGLSGNNLSGVYLGFQFGVDVEKYTLDLTFLPDSRTFPTDGSLSFDIDYKNTLFLSALNVGLQQQFSKSGYFDIKLGTGLVRDNLVFDSYIVDGQITNEPSSEITWKSILNYKIGLGFTLGNNENTVVTPICQVLEYHKNDKRLIKLGLINPHNLFSPEVFQGIFTAGIEQKIGLSPFSLNANLIYEAAGSFIDRFAFEFVPRYYYDLKRRQSLGKTGNSFSANYIGLRSKLVFDNNIGLAPIWGLQRQFFKRFLFDFSTGPERLHNFRDNRNAWNFFSELRIGIAF